MHVEFPASEHRVPLVRESLEMHDEELRHIVNLDLLKCRHMLFAFGAIPLVVAGKRLLLPKAREAIVDIHVPLIHRESWKTAALLGLEP